MFGMSSTDFWENDPQLYWAYRTFYLKKKEIEVEEEKYKTWLQGNVNCMATSISINNCFNGEEKQKKFPDYYELFNDNSIKEKLSPEQREVKMMEVNNYWARR